MIPKHLLHQALIICFGFFLTSCAGHKHVTKNESIPGSEVLKKKYATIIGVNESEITNVALYKFIDEWLEMNKNSEKHKNENIVCDLEIMAVKAVLDNSPLTQNGYVVLVNEIDNKCPRLERFLRPLIQNFKK